MTELTAWATEYMISPITLDHGLTQSSVRCILRDTKGYLWIGTDYGLNRYDNNKMSRYYFGHNHPTTITDNQVEFIVMAPQGTLLVGLAHGVVKYDYNTDTFDEITADGQRIDGRCGLATKDGVLIGSYGKLYQYDATTNTAALLPTKGGSASAYVKILHEWDAGSYLLQTLWDGMWLYNRATGTIERVNFCKDKELTSSEVDSRGTLWLSPFGKGLCRYDHSGKLIAHYTTSNSSLSSDIVLAMTESDGKLWVGSEQGLDIIDLNDQTVINLEKRMYGPRNCTILSLFTDHNTTVYAGTLRHGVLRIYQVPMRTFNNIDNTSSFFGFTVTTLLAATGSHKVWVGLDGEGIVLFDPIAETFEQVRGTDGLKVTSLAHYDTNNIILSSYNKGFKLLDTKTQALRPAPSAFDSIKELSKNKSLAVEIYKLNDGRILTVSDGLLTISPGDTRPKVVKFTAIRGTLEKLNPIYFDGNTLVVSDKRHIYRYNSAADTCGVIYSVSNGENITAATYDGEDHTWVATNKRLIRYNIDTHTINDFNNELVHNVTSLALENNRIWIGADNKLFFGYPDGAATVFGHDDGMSPNQFINKAELLTDDYLLLGGVNGLLKINRADIRRLLSQPDRTELHLSDVFVDNSRIVVNDGCAVVHNDHSIVTVYIIDNDHNGLGDKLFRYYIKGHKRDLTIETFDRSITLSLLPPGSYTVSVSYRQNDGKWSEARKLLTIDVQSPLWLRWWAILIYIALILAACILAYYYIRDKRHRRLEEVRQNAIAEKLNLVTKLHQQLRTPLTLILSPLNTMIERGKKGTEETSEEDLSALEDIYNNTIEMRNIIEALPETVPGVQCPTQATKAEDNAVTKASLEEESIDGDGLLEDFDLSPFCAVVVEDNDKLLSFIQMHLHGIFRSVETATNAREAMIKIKDLKPDIIIADVELADGQGHTLCREIKDGPNTRHIPVILLSPDNTRAQRKRCYNYGADSTISKPFGTEMLITCCKNLLLNRAAMRGRYEAKPAAANTVDVKTLTNSDESFLLQLDQLLADNLSNPKVSVEFLTKKMNMSRTTFYQRMRQVTGKSIGQYITEYRLAEAKKMLIQGKMHINEIAEALGFNSQRYFSTSFKDRTGMSPSEFRNANMNKETPNTTDSL